MELGWKYLTDGDKDAILRGIADGVAYGGPYHVEIHPADRCNIDCFFCSTASLRGTDELPIPRFEELLGELKAAGTRSIRFSGGGEPLFHRQIRPFLRAVVDSGIPIENVTTNAVLMDERICQLFLDARTDQVTISLNTGDAKTWGSMMQSPERNFDRVLENIRTLIRARNARKLRNPIVNLQYLVWRENYRSIPDMYRLARDLDVDTIQFNGLAFLREDQKMTPDETGEMMRLYEDILRVDEFRRISVVNSYEQDISLGVREISEKLTAERNARSKLTRLATFVMRGDFSLEEKLAHRRRFAEQIDLDRRLEGLEEHCIIAWHSLVIRTGGMVAPCCILQGSDLGNIYSQPLDRIWNGDRYRRLREELTRIMRLGADWAADPSSDRIVVPMCGLKGGDDEICPIRSFYFRTDVPFMKGLNARLAEIREAAGRTASAEARAHL
jgi:MoaA/NifB/PqqE/SkfB family radical SAM enzyme